MPGVWAKPLQKACYRRAMTLCSAPIKPCPAIPLAALGYLNPVVAGAAMAMSSTSVMINALLLKRWKPKV